MDAVATRSLRACIRGEVLLPGDGAYDSTRAVFNGTIDKHPQIIIRVP
jgi:hypothetical protein